MLESRWVDEGDGVLRYEICANAFCWQMVRAITGTLVEVGTGKRRPGEILGVLRGGDRNAAGQMAPPRGLVPLGSRLLTGPVPGSAVAGDRRERDRGTPGIEMLDGIVDGVRRAA